MSIYNKMFSLNEHKCTFEHGIKIETKNIYTTAFLMSLKTILFTFLVLPSLSLCLYNIMRILIV